MCKLGNEFQASTNSFAGTIEFAAIEKQMKCVQIQIDDDK